MNTQRSRRKSAALVAAGLIPVAGVLAGGAAPYTSADSAPPHVQNVAYRVAAPAPAPAPAPQPAAAKKVEPVRATAPLLPASVRSGAVPRINFEAYRAAEKTMAARQPRCGIDWKVIAGIGKVESHHANNGDVDRRGQLRTPIYGPVLDGSLAGNQVVGDTDGGALDGHAGYDRAVGPMQFLPATWKHYAADGNGDGKADPQNIFDAALTTAKYLCDDNLDLRRAADRTAAILRYNNSMEYVANVLGFARGY